MWVLRHYVQATLDCVSTWMGDRLGAGIICPFGHSCPSWVKVVLDNISVRQLGAVTEDLPLEGKLMVMNES